MHTACMHFIGRRMHLRLNTAKQVRLVDLPITCLFYVQVVEGGKSL